MKFGKEFTTHLEETLPEWRDKFLCYKPLKKLLKHFPNADSPYPNSSNNPSARGNRGAGDGSDMGRDQNREQRFVRILNEELHKFNEFYVDKEEEFIIRLQELKERIEQVKQKGSRGGVFTSERKFSEEMMNIRKDFVTFHGEMVLLKNYSSLNFAGLVKILKKYDKRTGGLLSLPFAQLALHQPFFAIETLTRLLQECEANLEILFPIEAEVIESSLTSKDQSKALSMGCKASSTFGEETPDIYRGTLAAMRALQGLQKASSTYNPLSFGALLKRVASGDSDGSVTSEDSTLVDKEADQYDAGPK